MYFISYRNKWWRVPMYCSSCLFLCLFSFDNMIKANGRPISKIYQLLLLENGPVSLGIHNCQGNTIGREQNVFRSTKTTSDIEKSPMNRLTMGVYVFRIRNNWINNLHILIHPFDKCETTTFHSYFYWLTQMTMVIHITHSGFWRMNDA